MRLGFFHFCKGQAVLKPRRNELVGLLWICGVVVGCGQSAPVPPVSIEGYDPYAATDHRQIQFRDDAKSNGQASESIADLSFTDINGNATSLKDYRDKKNVVLVVTRGFAGTVCIYCSTQTSRLLTGYSEFEKRDAEVVVVFPVSKPGDSEQQKNFVTAIKNKLDAPPEKIPFPIVLDVELKAVDQLGIRKDLSKPATYILDKSGRTRFAYVGESMADRPSVKALLNQLDSLNNNAQN